LVLCVLSLVSSSSAAADKDWPHYGGNQWNERHANLVPRRVMQLGQVGTSLSASPLVIDGVLYVSGSDGLRFAQEVDAYGKEVTMYKSERSR
jgi:glucose dehydrogenase